MKKLLLLLLLCAPAQAGDDTPVLTAMKTELQRAMSKLRMKNYEAPYFIAYSVRDYRQGETLARFGALVSNLATRNRQAYAEVRVGDYQLDNTTSDHEMSIDLGEAEQWEPPTDASLDDDIEALRSNLWLITDSKYKRALSAYAKKKGKRATTVSEDEDLPSFSKEPPNKHIEPPTPFSYDGDSFAARARSLSARFKQYPELIEGTCKFSADHVTHYFVNSEGSSVVTQRTIWALHLEASLRAKDGMRLQHEKDFYGQSAAELPDDAKLQQVIGQLAEELRALKNAPVVDPYTGPAMLMEEAAGVFFHETVGHRLEGERQNDEKEGRTFKGQVGKTVLPDFISVIDDPTTRSAGGESLNGYYQLDDEGIAARSVTLIQKGVLRDYIKSRTPITGSLHSNGHGRAEGVAQPMGRMGNLFVRSTKKVPIEKLKQMLLDEVRRQGKPYGLIIRDITGGSTNTSNFGYQAFKGMPRLVYRVDAKTGAETLVRGVEMVGTPLTTVSRIVATSDTEGVFNGYCGAESGFVPVSTVAPAVLMSEIELQRSQRALERAPILPAPWSDTKK